MTKLPSKSDTKEAPIRRLRRSRGLTQAGLAERTGISENSIARLDRGERLPRHATALLLAAALDCKPADLRGADA